MIGNIAWRIYVFHYRQFMQARNDFYEPGMWVDARKRAAFHEKCMNFWKKWF